MPDNIIGSAFVAIHPETSGFEEGLKRGTEGPIAALAARLGPGGILVGAVGGALAAVGGFAIDMGMKFDAAKSMIQAQEGITKAAADAIGNAFLSTGGKVTFSALEIAQAFGPVAAQLDTVNGGALSASQSLDFMTASMDLAEASGQPLTVTTAALAQVLQAFQLNVSDASAAGDILYNTSKALNIPIGDLVPTIDRLHAKLGPVGGDLNSISTLFVDLATHGLTGGRALLLVSSAVNTLLGGSKATAAEIKTLGLNVYDANGNFVGMRSIIGQLQPMLVGMTEQHRLLAEKELFGSTANKALDDSIMAGLPGYDAAAKKVTALGTAHKAATTSTDNLEGAWKRLKTRVEDVVTYWGQQLQPVLKGVVDWITNTAIPKLQTFADWFHNVGIPAVAGFIGALAGGNWDKVKADLLAIVQWIGDQFAKIPGLVQAAWDQVYPIFEAARTWLWNWAKTDLPPIVQWIGDQFAKIPGTIRTAWDHISPILARAATDLWNWAKTSIPPFLALVFGYLKDHIPGWTLQLGHWLGTALGTVSGVLLKWAADHLPDVAVKIGSLAGVALSNPEIAMDIAKGLGGAIYGAAVLLDTFVSNFVDSFLSSMLKQLGISAKDSPSTIFGGIGHSLITGLLHGLNAAKGAIGIWFGDLASQITGYFLAAPGWLINAGVHIIEGLGKGLDKAWTAVVTWLGGLGAKVISAIGNLSNTLWQAGYSLLDGFGKGLAAKWTQITGWLSNLKVNLPAVGGVSLPPLPSILPGFPLGAEGGYFTSPRLMVIGEAGGESLVPDRQRAQYIAKWLAEGVGSSGKGGAGGPGAGSAPAGAITITQHFHNNGGSMAEMQQVVRRENASLVAALRAGRR